MSLLDTINLPEDIKKLDFTQLRQLSQEIREFIVKNVAITGGHLASSLGTVELTIALHYVFDTPKDKIVWDVGHQAYAHKILTGRKNNFHTLRQYGGISGFPRREESEYDTFNTGHASTAVSAALGMVVARELNGEKYRVVAVIGDGSLSGGLTYEGLNHAGHLGYDFIVILNDNAMFISKSVGAIAKMLVKLLTLGLVKKVESKIEKFLRRMRYAGQALLRVAKRFKLLLFPGMLFEEMGFAYVGPVDGHDIKELIEVLHNVTNFRGPVVVHVITKKGKGYTPAETTPEKYHGVPPFDINTGEYSVPHKQTFTDVFNNTIISLAKNNKKIVGITAAMMEGCGLEEFAKLFPERFFDVGIAEEHAVTFAAGLAVSGYIPVCAIYSTFLQRAFDQIIHDVALQNLHVIFMIDRAGIVGEDGPTHHGSFDISYLRLIPNMTIFVPKDGEELKNMFFTAVNYIEGPVAIRYPKDYIPDSGKIDFNRFDRIIPGEAEILYGQDDAHFKFLIAGPKVYTILDCVNEIKHKCCVVNLRSVKPLDEELLKKIVRKDDIIITVEENTVVGGVFSAISEFVARNGIQVKVYPISIPDNFVTFGKKSLIETELGFSKEKIINFVNSL